jgi:drug/metabolite transporter (DMT)-like permease
MQRTSHHWTLGFVLALITAILWGVLPIALKLTLTKLDAWTITWCRFAGALLTMGVWLGMSRELPIRQLRDRRGWWWLVPASLGITGNYVMYLLGLSYTSPAVAQIVMQVAPLSLLILGMIFFHERFSGVQWLGFAVLVAGLGVFFNRRLPELLNPSEGFSFGVFLLVCSSVSWATYGLGQKKLQRYLNSKQILFLLYGAATVILLPTARPGSLLNLTLPTLLALIFCVANTVVAYGAFGMALEVWEVSRVSSVVSSAPLFTLAGSALAAWAALTWVTPESLNALSVIGACCVVAGSMVSALGGRSQSPKARAASRVVS